MYEVLHWMALNWIDRSQTEACITKSCEICRVLGHYAAQSGNSALMFQDALSVQLQGSRNPKREQSRTEIDTILFFGTLSIN
jgi:hypothetical protein